MKFFLVLFLAVLGIAWNAEARLGETKEKCEERYGKPLKEEDVGDAHISAYKSQGYIFWISFLNGKVDWMIITKGKPWGDGETDIFITKNALREGFVLAKEQSDSTSRIYYELSSGRLALYQILQQELSLYLSDKSVHRRNEQFNKRLAGELEAF